MTASNVFTSLDSSTKQQITECIDLAKSIFGTDLCGMYLYGSAIVGGLEKYSDVDLFIVTNRASTHIEKNAIVKALLKISGIYMKSEKRPLEITIIEKVAVNPWQYPPHFDFQYGEWLRDEFESGNVEPWSTKEMPDLALLITQILLASHTLIGPQPSHILCPIPHKDFIAALTNSLPHLMANIKSDTRNALLTLARIWSTLETNTMRPKADAADWVLTQLPKNYHAPMLRAKAICCGKEKEHWDDLQKLIQPCADFMLIKANNSLDKIKASDSINSSISLA